jgi:hypothetical protein
MEFGNDSKERTGESSPLSNDAASGISGSGGEQGVRSETVLTCIPDRDFSYAFRSAGLANTE